MKRGARASSDAMVGPEHLFSRRERNAVENVTARMARGERDVVWRVPVLGQNDMPELPHQAVDDGKDCLGVRDGETTAGTEVVLDIDDDENGVAHGRRNVVAVTGFVHNRTSYVSPTPDVSACWITMSRSRLVICLRRFALARLPLVR